MTLPSPTARELLTHALSRAIAAAVAAGDLPEVGPVAPTFEVPRDPKHGDYATNLAMTLARAARKAPPQIAAALARHLEAPGLLGAVEVANPGFLNLRLADTWLRANVATILASGRDYGQTRTGEGLKVLLEYVSANPTGPLHVGHGRWAALGSTLANLMRTAGYEVSQEFYINDAGNQMLNLGRSVLYRLEDRPFPEGEAAKEFYGGAVIHEVAAAARANESLAFKLAVASEEDKIQLLTDFARDHFLAAQEATLARLRVHFDCWYSERTLHAGGAVQRALDVLKERGDLYEQDGAWWLASTRYGDDKDRVVVRDNGLPTYLAADIAYHWDKLERGHERLINIWGADHHGYVPRMKAAVQALGYPADALEVIIGQLVSLYRGGEPVRMSKRTGEMVTLDEVIDEVGADATRFFLIMRSADTPVDFDLELAKQETADNPVFYVQYAHARICSILRNAAEQGLSREGAMLDRLEHADERTLMLRLASFPEEVARAADAREPHRMARFAQELAVDFHQFYTSCRVLDATQPELTRARLALAEASKITLANTLEGLLGVQAPERM